MEEHRLRMFGKMVSRRLFVSWREAATGTWSNLHNEFIYFSLSQTLLG
jgi:hypothetical protein